MGRSGGDWNVPRRAPLSFLALDFATDTLVKGDLLETRLRTSPTATAGRSPTPRSGTASSSSRSHILPPGARFTLRLEYEAPYFERAGGDDLWGFDRERWYPPAGRAERRHTTRSTRSFAPAGSSSFASRNTVQQAEEGWNVHLGHAAEKPVPSLQSSPASRREESTEDGVTCRVAGYGIRRRCPGKCSRASSRGSKFYE